MSNIKIEYLPEPNLSYEMNSFKQIIDFVIQYQFI